MTVKIYETDSYCKEFSATVLSCESTKDGYLTVLDKTAFFPEGGGQAADSGTIDNAKVLDVQIKNDIITHKTDAPLEVGKTVNAKIDWETRFERMQSHAGEHIVSGIVHSLFGYSNVGFHMSDSVMTIDFDGPLKPENIEQVELLANRAIYDNVPITVSYPTADELPSIDYRSKLDITEGVRLVTIDGVDVCACCAPHPNRTGEIGLIKILDVSPHKGGARVEMLAGVCALRDYLALHRDVKSVMHTLSAKRDAVADAVSREHETLSQLKAENTRLASSLALASLDTVKIGTSLVAFTKDAGYDELRFCTNELNHDLAFCIMFSLVNGEYIYTVASESGDVRGFVAELNTALSGRGGGRDSFAQGKVSAPKDEILAFLNNKLN